MAITPRQFEQLQQRVTRRAAQPVFESVRTAGPARKHRVILGIDPSLRGTGYGIVRPGKPAPQLVVDGTIACPAAWPRSRCLANILQVLRDVLREHHPDVCVVEGLFYAQNLRTALIMGEARGAALAVVAEAGLEIFEVAPRKVKQAIVGYGAAQKFAVARMVQRMLGLAAPPAPDAADALAVALTFAQEQGRYSLSQPKPI